MAHTLDIKGRTKDVLLEENVPFSSLLLPSEILQALDNLGFKKPSPIQLRAIPIGRCGFDLIVKSKSGTGKTLVFAIVALESIQVEKKCPQVVILAPTREIAVQIQETIQQLAKFKQGVIVECFIGGLSVESDIKKCSNCHIVVGAPGRITHLIELGHLKMDSVRLLVLDEADKLMEASFENDINYIYNASRDRKQMITTSATYFNDLDNFLCQYMLSPTHVIAEIESPLLLGLRNYIRIMGEESNVYVEVKAKNEELVHFLSNISYTQCLVFSNYQTRAEGISNCLNNMGWNCQYLTGLQKQKERLETIANFKEMKCRVLITTNIAARGLDIANVDLIINYDVPTDAATFLHRMGRAGRYGTSGVCITMVFEGEEMDLLKNIIGAIGGTNLSIPLLPVIKEANTNLFTIDHTVLPSISGTISELDAKMKDEVKKEVFEIKKNRGKNKKPKKNKESNKKGKNNAPKQKNDSKQINVAKENNAAKKNNAEEGKSSENDEDDDGFLVVNTETLIESMEEEDVNSAESENHTPKQDLMDTKALLELIASGEVDCTQLESNTQLKNHSPKQPADLEPNKSAKEEVFIKNKALLSVSKLLVENNQTPDTNDVDSVDEFLNLLKKQDGNKLTNKEQINSETKNVSEISASTSRNDDKIQNTSEVKQQTMSTCKSQQAERLAMKKDCNKLTNKEQIKSEAKQLSEISASTSRINDSSEVKQQLKSTCENQQKIKVDDENLFKLAYESAINPAADKTWMKGISNLTINCNEPEKPCDLYANKMGKKKIGYRTKKNSQSKKYNKDKKPTNLDSKDDSVSSGNQVQKNNPPKTVDDLLDDPDWAFLKWVPVEPKDKQKQDNFESYALDLTECDVEEEPVNENVCQPVFQPTCDERNVNTLTYNPVFCSYLDECSKDLWQQSMSFTSVPEFESWFDNEWHAKVTCVRNYIQQNIYVQEMSKYQKFSNGC
ncbi:probable ATP-dependent RNA helicase DDX20 [Aethina tumida]|uniref:probable ATP-dependent RNA helicase DDX20 n=1 Tax=Aethina tumida TaxID=116153 RepID=UPI0021495012|nr:probable ATP-dependent RNA helicase DDX20 [Aethina tumida]XP_049818766.1 probable ATP-dependent RNA helicase DDX20 [Aethina tumida]